MMSTPKAKAKEKRRQLPEAKTMRERGEGFHMRCSTEFLAAMAQAAEATGMTKTQMVEQGLAAILPLYFAKTVRAAGAEMDVQNTHIKLFNSENVSEAGSRRVKKSR